MRINLGRPEREDLTLQILIEIFADEAKQSIELNAPQTVLPKSSET
jgi:hypothetical protein